MKGERVGRRPRSIHHIYPARFEHSTDKSILQTLKATLLYQCISLLVVRPHTPLCSPNVTHMMNVPRPFPLLLLFCFHILLSMQTKVGLGRGY